MVTSQIMNQNIIALSWKQPFATAMLFGKIETRSWNTNYRGRVLICASQAPFSIDAAKLICGPKLYSKLCDLVSQDMDTLLCNGFAIAIGDLVDCRPMRRTDMDKCYVPFNHSLFCHVYENVQKIHPFSWTGAQRWKKVETQDKKSITIL
jgi:hypothetical protein